MVLGSSPLTRGALCHDLIQGRAEGLIPAHAGSTAPVVFLPAITSAHPRSRGEHRGDRPVIFAVDGSSPLTRGARPPPARRRGREGLIPAHAGSTCSALQQRRHDWAHPRSRGEHGGAVTALLTGLGSSPLTRGALVAGPVMSSSLGLIPAHAGSTWCR